MDEPLKKTSIFLFCILFSIIISFNFPAKAASKSKENRWSASVSGGVAFLTREISKDFVVLKNEFQHQPGWALDLNIGRTFGSHWEPSLKAGLFYLHGKSDTPDFSAVGNHHSLSGVLYEIPVQYVTLGGSASGVIRYYLKKFSNRNRSTLQIDPYLEAGAGVNIFSTELNYQNPPPGSNSTVIFQRGVDNKQTIANVVQVIFGAGTKIGNPEKTHFILSYNADVVNYACLDAVHNYTDNQRNHAKGIISKFTAGIVIPMGTASGGNGGSRNDNYPWSP